MRISDWSSYVCSSDLGGCQSRRLAKPPLASLPQECHSGCQGTRWRRRPVFSITGDMADSRRNGSRGRAGGAGGNGRSRTAASKSKGGGSGKGRRAKAARAAGLLRRALTWAAVAGVWCVIAFGGVLAWYASDLPELDRKS